MQKTLFSFLMVGLVFTVLQVSTSQAQVMSSEEERKDKIQGGVAGEDKGGQGRIRNKMTHGAKQGRKVPGTKTSGNYADEESKAGEHQNAHDNQITEQREREKASRAARIKACVARAANDYEKETCKG